MLVSWLIALLLQQPPLPPQSVTLDFPESVELRVIVEYAAQTLGLSIFYDDEVLAGKRVSLRASGPIDRDALLGLTRALLRSRSLALIRSEQSNWYRIVPTEKIAAEVRAARVALDETVDPGEVVALSIPASAATIERTKPAITAMLTKPGGALQLLPESGEVLVIDFADTVRSVQALLRAAEADQTSGVETIEVRHQDVSELAAAVGRLIGERGKGEAATGGATVQADPVGKRLIVLGNPIWAARVRELVQRLDQPDPRQTRIYSLRNLNAVRAKTLAEQLFGAQALRIVTDEVGNSLIITARDDDHVRLKQLWQDLDQSPLAASASLRFYKLMNRRALDVFATLAALLGQPAGEQPSGGAETLPSAPGAAARSPIPTVPANAPSDAAPTPDAAAGRNGSASSASAALHGPNFSLSTDVHTNTILVVGPPDLHAKIERIIEELDKRRPQVLVEVTLVSISVDDSANLGVELESLDLGYPWDYLLFTSFGLSTINPTTGARRLTPLPGGSGALIAPDEVPLIVQALASDGRTRIYSAPRILVDDNASGSIESVAESPFTSVNASNTVATTSFAGFAKAGTQLTIEPHIAEGAHLEIRYDLTVSSFTGAGVGGAPPPRSADTITSTVRVPEGYTVVVGGLTTETTAESVSQVPLIGDVPLLGWLFGNRSQSTSRVRLYAFIRPTVLRSEEFEDLKYISARDLDQAELPSDLPPDRVLWMH